MQLGFLDVPITELHKNQVDFTTNKLGGLPVSTTDLSTFRECVSMTEFMDELLDLHHR